MKVRTISQCRICGGTVKDIIDLGSQELTGVFPEPNENVEVGELSLVKCDSANGCGLVQLRHTFEADKMYGENYGYRSGLNKSMIVHLRKISKMATEIVTLHEGDFVLDIGSNDGTLLGTYDEYLDINLMRVGIDPSGEKFSQYYKNDILLIPTFFSANKIKEELGNKQAKIITSIAMFYDLENPIEFASNIYSILDDEGIWVAEQSYMPMMVKANSYDTICHEHIEYYSLKQILWIADKVGFKVIDVGTNDTNGGSFCVVCAKKESNLSVNSNVWEMIEYEKEKEVNTISYMKDFQSAIDKSKADLLAFLTEQKERGKLVLGYGASTKGNVVLQYCGIDKHLIPAIAEVNEDKFGKVTPGTRIPIISEAEAKNMNPDYFLVLPWHFKQDILQRENEYMDSSGCKFVFHLPKLEIYGAEGIDRS